MKENKWLAGSLVVLFLLMNFNFQIGSMISGFPVNSSKLIIAIPEEPVHMDPAHMTSTVDLDIFQQISDGLVTFAFGNTLAVQPAVATNWTISDDKSTYNFSLREDVRFHDGTDLKARDVKFSFERAMPVGGFEGLCYTPRYPNITVVDDYTIMIELGAPTPFLLLTLAQPKWGILPKATYDVADPSYFDAAPIGCGPFKFNKWEAGSYILLDRFDDYYGKRAGFAQLEFDVANLFGSTPISAAKFFVNNGVPAIAVANSGKDLQELITVFTTLNASTANSIVFSKPVWSHGFFQMNIAGSSYEEFKDGGRYPFNQVWMRRALSRSLNRPNIDRTAFSGLVTPAPFPIHPDSMTAFPGLNTSGWFDQTYDPDWSEAIMDTHGHTGDFDWYSFNTSTGTWFNSSNGLPDWQEHPNSLKPERHNRFGYGPYMNDTDDDGNLTNGIPNKGHHFILATSSCNYCVLRSVAVYSDLLDIGIFTDVYALEHYSYQDIIGTDPMSALGEYNETTGEYTFNETTAPQWEGAKADFWIGDLDSPIGLPSDWVAYGSHSIGYNGRNYQNGGFGPDPWWENMTHELFDKGYEVNSTEWINTVNLMANQTTWDVPHIWLYWNHNFWVMHKAIKGFIFMKNRHLFAEYLSWESEITTTYTISLHGDGTERSVQTSTTTTSGTSSVPFTPGFTTILTLLCITGVVIIIRKRKLQKRV